MSTMRNRHVRRGVAVVEMAVVTPVLVMLILGTVEIGWMLMTRHTLALAAREGARAASLPDATILEVQSRVTAAMGGSSLTGYTVTSNLTSLGPGDEEVWVELSIPFDRYALTGNLFGGGIFDIVSRVTMHLEGV